MVLVYKLREGARRLSIEGGLQGDLPGGFIE